MTNQLISKPDPSEPSIGRLYLVPTPLDFGCDNLTPISDVIPSGSLAIAANLGHWISENAKSTRAYLKRVGEVIPLSIPVQSQNIQELPREIHKKGDHLGGFNASGLLTPALAGHDMGLISEAGMPAVADPGSSVVRAAHELGIEVVPLVGPVSILLALAASGLNGQNFAFVGYLPQDTVGRMQRLTELEAIALKTGQAQLFIETPYRNSALLQSLMKTLQHNTRLAVCTGLTLQSAEIKSQLVKAWRQQKSDLPNHIPAVFAIGR